MMWFVEEERLNIGTLSALGYRHRDLALKFILYSSLASLIGVVFGELSWFYDPP